VYHPFRLPTLPCYVALFEAFERICRANLGRSHSGKAHESFEHEREERGSEWATARKRQDEESRWTNRRFDRHWGRGIDNESCWVRYGGLGCKCERPLYGRHYVAYVIFKCFT
jgi:hypothetical protein